MALAHTKKPSGKTSTSAASSKPKRKPSSGPKPSATQHKPKSGAISSQIQQKRKKPPHLRYTEKELNIPQLNGIKPAGVQKPTNAKKGKNFVDDREGMNAILALVMAEKEGNIESKMMRARQMEEIREARRLEAEKRAQSKKEGLEERKQGIKGSKSRHKSGSQTTELADADVQDAKPKSNRKRVSFG